MIQVQEQLRRCELAVIDAATRLRAAARAFDADQRSRSLELAEQAAWAELEAAVDAHGPALTAARSEGQWYG